MRYFSTVAILLTWLTIKVSGYPGFFDSITQSLTTSANSLASFYKMPQFNLMRLLEEGPKEPCPVVKTLMGNVKGSSEFSREKTVFFSYLGIPYAKALRFEPPTPWNEPWAETRDAVEYAPVCLQFDFIMSHGITGSEDCLFLNVYTTTVDPEKKLNVIIHLHGGIGGMLGNPKGYHPKYLMDKEVVFVSLNYRLGALGFLNSGEGTIKGNNGMKDQALAMKWVQQNIQFFGGDPKKVTLMGDSSGAVAAHFHALSESSAGLFHRIILQSGHALSPWGFTTAHYAQFKNFAMNFDCPQTSIPGWLACMKEIDPLLIVGAHSSSENPVRSPLEMFTVTLEKPEKGAIVTINPFAVLESGNFTKLPIIFGVNKADGAGKTSRIVAHDEIKKTLAISWSTYVPIILQYMDNPKISNLLKRHYYLLGADGPEDDITPVMQMITDADFLFPLHQVLEYYRKSDAEVYAYQYNFKGQCSFYPALRSYSKGSIVKGHWSVASSFASDYLSKSIGRTFENHEWGPVFGDQLLTFFLYSTAMELLKESEDYAFSEMFVKGLLDFVNEKKNIKFGEVDWAPVKKDGESIEMMIIDKVPQMTSYNFRDIVPFYEGLHIRDPPPQFAKPSPSLLKKGDL